METEFQKLQKQVQDLTKELNDFKDLYYRTNMIDKQIYMNKAYFKNDVYLPNKIAFFGDNTPIAKQPAITPPSGGTTVDYQARSSIGSLITTLTTLGLTA